MHILVTGANGFIGEYLCRYLEKNGCRLRRCFRNPSPLVGDNDVVIGDLNGTTCWDAALKGIDTVIHLAGKAHTTTAKKSKVDGFWEVNCEGTQRLASDAALSGVTRFIFLSSIAVYGSNITEISDSTEPDPETPYGVSKYGAEFALQKICSNSQMSYVILRPPLVYGANAPGNILTLKKLVSLGLPLPFASVENKRSMISLKNLSSIIHVSMTSDGAQNEVFLVSDTIDVTTCDLMRMVGTEIGRRCIFFHFPERWLYVLLNASGLLPIFNKAFGTLLLDTDRVQRKLNWQPVEAPLVVPMNARP